MKEENLNQTIWIGMSTIPSLVIDLYFLISVTVVHLKYFHVADTFLVTSTQVHRSLSASGF